MRMTSSVATAETRNESTSSRSADRIGALILMRSEVTSRAPTGQRKSTTQARTGSPAAAGEVPYAADVKRVLLTGMSGTGKSAVISRLAARGYKAVDMDYDGWSELVEVPARTGLSGLWRIETGFGERTASRGSSPPKTPTCSSSAEAQRTR